MGFSRFIVHSVKQVVDVGLKYNPVTLPIKAVRDLVKDPSLETLGAVSLSTNLQTASFNSGGKAAVAYGVETGLISPGTQENITDLVDNTAGVITTAVATYAAGSKVSDMMKGSVDGGEALDKAGKETLTPDTASIFSNKWFWIIGGGVGMVLAIAHGRK